MWCPLAKKDALSLLSGMLRIDHYQHFSVVRDNHMLYNVVLVEFDEPNEVREADRDAFMQTMLLAAELKVQDWKEKNETPV